MNCVKCGKQHDGKFGSGKYCSRSCANSRERSLELRERVSKKLKNPPLPPIVCGFCGKGFSPKNTKRKFCSRDCARRNNIKLAAEKQKECPPNWSEIHRNAYSKGNNYVAGGTTKWLPYKDIKVQGTYELRMCYILDEMVNLKQISSWGYATDRIKYIDADGAERTYILDFTVVNNDGSFYYIETKGYEKENDQYKWKAVKDLGHQLVVAFEQDIKKMERTYALVV